MMKKKFNWWRLVALVVIGLNLGVLGFVGYRAMKPVEMPVSNQALSGQPALNVNLTRDQANRIVDYYLNDYLKDSPVKYKLTLGDSALLSGQFKFLGASVDFQLQFDPLVLANGDVVLKARKLNVGSLPVPIGFVLNYIGNSYKLPAWVKLSNSKETVTLQLSKLKMANGMRLRATKLDLTNDALSFAVYLPQTK
ncbi:hypothetical protein IV56_GL001399 [Lacticaseibacillus saniviri JCM 17471 = DSM 24301]|uniref:DUF2140 family protein n=2 Tax=Lacticaseibacillus saniviri TaxID=931533 RepID=A0A0R2MZL0_9LACO|nr:hypothetical protein IV56_GL001399 [Lacticaseibacillus saniviri JCM 17471 = DSM 24301]